MGPKPSVFAGVLLVLIFGVSLLALRGQPVLDAARRPGADKQANIGSTVTDPVTTQQPNAQRIEPQHPADKAVNGEADAEEVLPPEVYRERPGVPTIEAEIPEAEAGGDEEQAEDESIQVREELLEGPVERGASGR